jgi:hypothetical protein
MGFAVMSVQEKKGKPLEGQAKKRWRLQEMEPSKISWNTSYSVFTNRHWVFNKLLNVKIIETQFRLQMALYIQI